jgi:hypothetical protein
MVTYSQSHDMPSDGRDSGRGEIESLRRMRVSEPLLITDSAGEPIGLHLGVVGMTLRCPRRGRAEAPAARNVLEVTH